MSKASPSPTLTFLSGFLDIVGGHNHFREEEENLEITVARLVEWVELVTALGAEKIFVYNLEVHPNMIKVQFWGLPKYDQ